MADDPAFVWDRNAVTRTSKPSPTAPTASQAVEFGDRITIKEAEQRFGVSVPRLREWARGGSINAVKGPGPRGGRMWLVTAESVARHLADERREAAPPAMSPAPRPASVSTPPARTGPTEDGTAMLVPRDAWDRLMDQLGNLHDAGVQLAEARERAARAETEAGFLRERLTELRTERDDYKSKVERNPTSSTPDGEPEPFGERLKAAVRRLLGD
ncbi:MAG TPA: helix-turn-helix domain-containing protein [Acidimicrobiia bacterium]|nr:helix-turn-helix domain-containing protein [Acidimicrobiia bacterium]